MSRSGNPLVTVTIPMYNNERYIAETIGSVLNQTMDDFELLIYDDHSTDRSLEIACSFDDPRITIFDSEQNLGPEGNWNRAISDVRGRYVKLLCADDLLFPECLEKQLAAFELSENEGVSLVSAQRAIIDPEGKVLINKVNFIDGGLKAPDEVVRKMVRLGTNIIGEPVCGLYPAGLIASTSGYSARIPYTIDLDFWMQLLRLGNLWMIDEPLCAFRISNLSWSSRIGEMRHKQFLAFMEDVAADELFQINDLDLFIGRFNSAVQSMTSLMGFKLFAGSAAEKRVIPVQ
ncbi:glycosyltransferase family 2 protein [Chlorobaculum sp. MV4-Y]|uniref:glycosyltransferase family 2 protein n=1 Tax=Chlorobaculum sp. MV4-Y TaxID=2976335 RepID=UPI0021AFDAAB|nr:glycosyltransferase family A protein [Chlorobaculum sp. MV4-Y]UWX58670.1 glycosyltransferase family 2 protein [Chlorobaculum sp. MV4-Y]